MFTLKYDSLLQQLNKKTHDFSHWDELPFFFSTRRKTPISRFARDIGAFFVVSYFKRKARAFKGKTSRILREEFPWLKSRTPSLWTRSYFGCTVGHIGEETIQRYIDSQKGK